VVVAASAALAPSARSVARGQLSSPLVANLPPQPLVPPLVVQSGRHFVDRSSGKPIVLHGVNATPYDPIAYKQAVALGANFVRIPLYWSDVEPEPPVGGKHYFDSAVLTDLGREVRYLRNHGVAALIDFHQYRWSPYFAAVRSLLPASTAMGIPSWVYQRGRFAPNAKGLADAIASFYTNRAAFDDFTAFVSTIVDRYRKYPNVIGYELLNEPPTGSLPQNHRGTQIVLDWEARVAAVVRKHDPLRTVFIMARGGSDLGLEHADLSAFGSLRHIALDVHDYFSGTISTPFSSDGELSAGSWSATHLQLASASGSTIANQRRYLQPALERTTGWRIPLLVGEWGARNDDPALLAYQQQMVALFDRVGANWTRWTMARTGRFGLLNPDGSLTPAARQLNELGAFAVKRATG
jgi:aryl-phospho-beta-D-glucosidase BglC (GH1 family)